MITDLHLIVRPIDRFIAGRLIYMAFNLYDRDYLNGKVEMAIDERAQIVIDAYEANKYKLYDTCEFVI